MQGEPAPADSSYVDVAAGLGRRRSTLHQGRVGVDGFSSGSFESKLERERRYGEVFRLDQHEHGLLLRLELPRCIPDSALKRARSIADEMPDYVCSVDLCGGELTVRGSLADPEIRKLAAVSPAFPADFQTTLHLPPPHRWRMAFAVTDKVLEVALVRS